MDGKLTIDLAKKIIAQLDRQLPTTENKPELHAKLASMHLFIKDEYLSNQSLAA